MPLPELITTGSSQPFIRASEPAAALALAKAESRELQQLADMLKAKVGDTTAKLEALLAQAKGLEKEFAQLKKEYSLETVTLEQALDLFKLPRTLGELDNKTVTVGTGRFGPYVRYDNTFVSIPKTMDPMTITLEEAEEMLRAKREVEAQKVIKTFAEEPDLQILNGRYGPYIAYQKKNYKIPSTVEPADLNLETCFKVIELQKAKGENRKARSVVKKKK